MKRLEAEKRKLEQVCYEYLKTTLILLSEIIQNLSELVISTYKKNPIDLK